MEIRPILDRTPWNQAVASLPAGHVLQSWDWGTVKRVQGWLPHRWLWEHRGSVVAAAQILVRPIPHTPWSVMYVPKGPAMDYQDQGAVRRVLHDLESFAVQERAVFVKIDPDANLPSLQKTLLGRGWRYSAEQIQFRNTALLDLTPSEADLLSAMKSKTRYNVRLAARRGVVVRPGAPRELEAFYDMYAETGNRDGFPIRPFEYYRQTWGTFLETGLAYMLLAEVEDTLVAGLILFRFGDTAWYMYGASTSRHRNRMPNYALQWEAIRWAKAQGCTTYDLWGAPETMDESDPLWGVWRFKEGLGARFAPHIGAYDYPVSRLLYRAYGALVPRYLDLLRLRNPLARRKA